MPPPESAADRWILREGWYFLRWTVDREMVRGHDRIGYAFLGLGALTAPLVAMIDPMRGVITGIGVAAIGAVHLGMSIWAQHHPEVRDRKPPRLSYRARKMLKPLVRSVAGTDTLGQKYYTKLLRQSAPTLKSSAQNHLNSVAFQALEDLAATYNPAVGAALEFGATDAVRALQEGLAQGLDWVAALQEFPEREQPKAHLEHLVGQMNSLRLSLEGTLREPQGELQERLAALTDLILEAEIEERVREP